MRGLNDLRTLTGRSDTQIPAHKAYLRISFLELERARRMQEIRTARARFDTIEGRFREIDAEICSILGSLNGSCAAGAPCRKRRASRPSGCIRRSAVSSSRTEASLAAGCSEVRSDAREIGSMLSKS